MSHWQLLCLIEFLTFFWIIHGFIPHPSIRFGGQAGDSITHTEITQLGFIRSLTKFFTDRKLINNIDSNEEYTIDELYQLIYPTWTNKKIAIETYTLKSILDIILAENAFVDIDQWTKKLSAAHFDSEAFQNASRRIIKMRQRIVNNVLNRTEDLKETHQLLGQILHTLQDFYSHSNWIELGKKDINEHIGITEDIGPIAEKNQSTCTNDGCIKIEVKCKFLQKLTLKNCPLIYYECKNNIRKEILEKNLLTSGYSVNQHNEDSQPIDKPKTIEKCSHGSVFDTSSHIPAIGGINKDSVSPIYSPHFDLHYPAATLAVLATERFFNDLRKDINDKNFDRLFAIHPTDNDLHNVPKVITKFKYYSASVSSGVQIGLHFFKNIKQKLKKQLKFDHDSSENISFRRKRFI